jgi:hypothetical protein
MRHLSRVAENQVAGAAMPPRQGGARVTPDFDRLLRALHTAARGSESRPTRHSFPKNPGSHHSQLVDTPP